MALITIYSFSYKGKLPHAADACFDCRNIANPHHIAELRHLTGRDEAVQTYVQKDPAAAEHIAQALALLIDDGVKSVAFGCYGGRHRSVAVAEMLAARLRKMKIDVEVKHLAL